VRHSGPDCGPFTRRAKQQGFASDVSCNLFLFSVAYCPATKLGTVLSLPATRCISSPPDKLPLCGAGIMSPDDWKVQFLPSFIVAGAVGAVAWSGSQIAAAIRETNNTVRETNSVLRAPAAVFVNTAPEMTRSVSEIADTMGRLERAEVEGKFGWFPFR